jgi:hypothetical protein
MESIPTEYFIFIYTIMALPFILAILGVVSLVVVARLYFTNRRNIALKILKVWGVVIILLLGFTLLTKASLGI